MEGHSLHFGRREFSLITGFHFGTINFDIHPSSDLKFHNEDEEMFGKLYDDDAIRLCLLLAVEMIFMGRSLTFKVDDTLFRHSDEHYYGLKKDSNYVPTYTLSGFIWILETFERCETWWIKDLKVIPRALGWSKKSLFTRSDYSYLFAKESRSTSDLRPTIAEYQSSWWIDNIVYFQDHILRAPPIKEHHRLFETYLAKLEKARKRGKKGFMVSSIGGRSDNSVKKKWLNDLVIMELNYRVFKLETIIQVLAHERNDRQPKLQFTDAFRCMTSDLYYLREKELRLCLEDEEMLRCEHEKLIVEENRFRLDESNRLRLEEVNMLQLEEQKKKKQKEFMNSSHGKNILAKLVPAKRNQLGSSSEKISSKVSWVKIKKYRQHVNYPCTAKLLKNVKPWVEDISRVLHCMDTVWLSDDIERFLGHPGQVKCKFPWNDDYTVDRNFWLKLVCLDPTRKGWLTEEVFIPINETGEHWCLAQFHILSGEVTFYDTGYTYDYDYRDWYVQERHEQILDLQIFMGSNVAAKSVRLLKEFKYDDLESTRGMMRLIRETQLKVLKKISFIALLRSQLAHSLSLDVDDPVDVSLAYREKMV
ncbi:phospholipase-like protein [Tanacetum coccineum]